MQPELPITETIHCEGEPEKPKKKRAAPKTKIVVLTNGEAEGTFVPATQQPATTLRTKEALSRWMQKHLPAGEYSALRTIVKMSIEEETKVTKKVRFV